ncbi:enoyl-CoA hydratase-related protein [Pseudonocardia sp. ICBG162]|uniref:enoyl-CoA hydratase-related protein n=1 Tax=Pseudonocardia sp. ICBG162 TaxID=2846761 RepID=UPI001CF6543D|nr:enoyl-CoA hydratase-related protein [Pseudonocardia sp. ICBG162]
MPSHVTLSLDAHVLTVTLDRPDRLNAFTDRMEAELVAAFDRADTDDEVRVVVLTGAGRAFCAGMDLAEADPDATFAHWRSSDTAPPGTRFDLPGEDLPLRRDGGGQVVLRMLESRTPIIAAVNGPAIGVGAGLTLAADLRLAADTARFAFPFTRLGVVPESCSSWLLPRLVPVQQAFEWVLTGRRFDAGEALRGGLLRSVHPAAELADAVRALAVELTECSPTSVSLARRMLLAGLGATHPVQAHQTETLALNRRGTSADAREGVRAFLERRPPRFTDRVSDAPDVLPAAPAYAPPPGARPHPDGPA